MNDGDEDDLRDAYAAEFWNLFLELIPGARGVPHPAAYSDRARILLDAFKRDLRRLDRANQLGFDFSN